jgi:hypothetical protein
MNYEDEAVLKDEKTGIHVPVAVKQGRGGHKVLLAQTFMKKKNFGSDNFKTQAANSNSKKNAILAA